MIKVENLNKSFEEEKVLYDINATFYDGQTNLIIGKSGSGKSVLVKCMVGLLEPTSGTVYYDDLNFTELSFYEKKDVRTKIGMLFQGNALFDSMTVQENVMFPLNMFTKMKFKEKLERVNFCLERVDLAGQNIKLPAEISGGMQKRVGIARAIVMNPKYLICDEPNSGLDPRTAMVIDGLIQQITEEYEITTIINTHDMNSVMEHGDHVVLLHEGTIHWTGKRQDILYADNEILDDFIFASNFLKQAKKAMLNEK